MYSLANDRPIIDLAHFDTQDAADAAIEDWAYLHRRPDGLNRLRNRIGRGEGSLGAAPPQR